MESHNKLFINGKVTSGRKFLGRIGMDMRFTEWFTAFFGCFFFVLIQEELVYPTLVITSTSKYYYPKGNLRGGELG